MASKTKVFTEKYLPEAFPLNDPRKADIKLGHLLSMAGYTWCAPGDGYSYTSQSPHVVSIVLRHLVDMEMQQSEYIEMAGKPSPYQKHAPFSLMFEVNADGHVAGAPRDTFFKSGGAGMV